MKGIYLTETTIVTTIQGGAERGKRNPQCVYKEKFHENSCKQGIEGNIFYIYKYIHNEY